MKSKIEQILIEQKENFNPREEVLFSILNQIPEKRIKSNIVIKSPYFWMSFAQVISLCFLLIVVYPTYKNNSDEIKIEQDFAKTDSQMEAFESFMDSTDYDDSSSMIQ